MEKKSVRYDKKWSYHISIVWTNPLFSPISFQIGTLNPKKEPSNNSEQLPYYLYRLLYMDRLQKIAFIKSYWTFKNVYDRLEDYPDKMLDQIIRAIVSEMQVNHQKKAIDHVLNAPVYLN